ncbi:hypothetical protein KSC_052740 [Ktedonobacter sp. SOSP1-52]|nr:hypothetical protein KSC_052740 [Ktedonobacter sp. SOSP1-52]
MEPVEAERTAVAHMEPAEVERTAAVHMSLTVMVVCRRSEEKSLRYKVLDWHNKDRLARLGTM